MQEVNYGRIALIPKGDFSGAVQYEQGDVVTYEGSSYLAKARPPVATLPTDTRYWQISAQGSKYIYINLTTAEYNERLAAYRADPSYIDPDTGTLFSETLYNITDDYETLARTAEGVKYTDTYMLGSTNVQGIIDIIAEKVANQLLSKSDVVDNLLSTDTNLPLSARQGKILGEKDYVLPLVYKDANTVDEINAIYDTFSADMGNAVHYNGMVVHKISHPLLGGGRFYIEGVKTDNNHEYQIIRVYGDAIHSGAGFFRNKYNGKWQAWTKIITENNLKLQLIGSVAGRTALNVDTTKYTEFLVRVYKHGRAVMSVIVLSQELPVSRAFSTYINPSNNICLSVNCTKTYFQVIQMWENNSGEINQIPDTVTLTVYGR